MANNNILFNAAVNGYIAGSLAGQNISNSTALSYDTIAAQAQAFATQLDSQIPNDATISTGPGAAVPPTTAAITEDGYAKSGLIQMLSYGFAQQRWGTGQVSADFAVPCAAIKAAYTQALTKEV